MGESQETPHDRIELAGEYDLTRRDELHELLSGIDGNRPIIIDVRRVSYVDSSFLNELAILRKSRDGCAITIEGPSPMMKRLLSLMSFDKLFKIA
jgi:anti-anti-sigma factor